MQGERRDVASIEAGSGLGKVVTTIRATINARAGCRDHDTRIVRHDRNRVRIELGSVLDTLPGLAPIFTSNDPTFFNRTKDQPGVAIEQREPLNMAHMGRVGKCPLLCLGKLFELLAVSPGLPTIGALEHRRRPGADKQITRFGVLDQRPGFLVDNPVVDLPPAPAAIFAA